MPQPDASIMAAYLTKWGYRTVSKKEVPQEARMPMSYGFGQVNRDCFAAGVLVPGMGGRHITAFYYVPDSVLNRMPNIPLPP